MTDSGRREETPMGDEAAKWLHEALDYYYEATRLLRRMSRRLRAIGEPDGDAAKLLRQGREFDD